MRNRTGQFLRILSLLTVIIQGTGSALFAADLSPTLVELVDRQELSDSLVSVVIFGDDAVGAEQAKAAAAIPGRSRQKAHELAVNALRFSHRQSLAEIKERILAVCSGAEIKEFWIAPVLAVRIPAGKLAAISEIDGIRAIYEDAVVELIEPVEMPVSAGKITEIKSHLEALNIPAVWNRGYTGQGRLVCNFDTGVEGTHPALASKWRGNHTAAATAFFAPSSTDTLPFDRVGHGTHTMGLMLGNNEIDTFGVAPDAEWIGAAVVDQGQSLSRTIADIIAAFQWAADPDGNPATVDDVPDAVLNSWGIPTTVMDPCDETFYQVIDNLEAAGAVTIFAAGNEGPEEMSLRIPANRATSPLNSFAVGAIDHGTNVIAGFSSRGPSSCDPTAKKPEVVAPGVGLYSSYKGGTYTLKNGTSMAAPLIAGLVALMRQYNPEATVNQIKTAIIQSARDMGVAGEDNTYGYGLPDALKALEYMPAPPVPNFAVHSQFVGNDGIAEPGETFNLFVILETIGIVADSVRGRLVCEVPGVEIITDTSIFIFENKSTQSLTTNPFTVFFEPVLTNGEIIPMQLWIELPYNQGIDTLSLQVTVGVPIKGRMLTHSTARMQMTVTDFGQHGLGDSSVFPAGGDGFTFGDSENLLYEAGIIIGRNALQISTSVRDSLGNAYNSDFSAVHDLDIIQNDAHNGFISRAGFTDTGSDIPIPIVIDQKVITLDQPGSDASIIFEYDLINNSSEYITNLYWSAFFDFDLDVYGDRLVLDSANDLLIQFTDSLMIGWKPLTAYSGFVSETNTAGKIGLTNAAKYGLINRDGNDVNISTVSEDLMTLVNFGPYDLMPHDTMRLALAIVAATDLTELQAGVVDAANRYHGMTDVAEERTLVPDQFTLHQNYPNPFNPATTITFSLARAGNVRLAVFNILGQEVNTLFDGYAPVGKYEITWDGTDDFGRAVASGVYFYRLETDFSTAGRKMVLVK